MVHLTFKQLVHEHTLKKNTPVEMNFMYLGNKEIFYSFKT
jgi:hypothetical protein